jgi:L-galactose dehydrogenase
MGIIEYVDVQQIIKETLPAMRRLQKAGKCRSIGVSGYPLAIFKQIMDAMDQSAGNDPDAPPLVDFVLCYARYGLHDTSLDLIAPELAKRGLGLIHAAPLATGNNLSFDHYINQSVANLM